MKHMSVSKTIYIVIYNILDAIAPEKTVKIQTKNIIRSQWMTSGLLKSSYTV